MLERAIAEDVIWHDAECGAYREDLGLWLALADATGGPVADVGAGTGRVALALAEAGHEVIACDIEQVLIDELLYRASAISAGSLSGVVCDARDLNGVPDDLPLVIVPMQSVQLLGGMRGRRAFMRAAQARLRRGGVLAMAIANALAAFDGDADGLPPADTISVAGELYVSQTVAITEADGQATIHRIRTTQGDPSGAHHTVSLDLLTADELETEAAMLGFSVLPRQQIFETSEYVGSTVVMLRA